jgi:hypothetical protein
MMPPIENEIARAPFRRGGRDRAIRIGDWVRIEASNYAAILTERGMA